MSSKQTITLASRLLCLWFSYGVVTNLFALPTAVLIVLSTTSLAHPGTLGSSYTRRMELTTISHSLLWLLAEVPLAIIFYRCGPLVTRFLLGDVAEEVEVSSAE